jgi:hypothetical protein
LSQAVLEKMSLPEGIPVAAREVPLLYEVDPLIIASDGVALARGVSSLMERMDEHEQRRFFNLEPETRSRALTQFWANGLSHAERRGLPAGIEGPPTETTVRVGQECLDQLAAYRAGVLVTRMRKIWNGTEPLTLHHSPLNDYSRLTEQKFRSVLPALVEEVPIDPTDEPRSYAISRSFILEDDGPGKYPILTLTSGNPHRVNGRRRIQNVVKVEKDRGIVHSRYDFSIIEELVGRSKLATIGCTSAMRC